MDRQTDATTFAAFAREGAARNRAWLLGAGRGHWLATAWEVLHRQGDLFSRTSCEVTAMAVRELVTPEREWARLEGASLTFADARRLAGPVFQASLGVGGDCEHILTVWGDATLQSYYGEYEARADPLTAQVEASLDDPGAPGSYETITCGVRPQERAGWEVTYWAPRPQ